VQLAEWSAPLSAAPGGELTALFYWRAAGAAPQDYGVFFHLRDATNETIGRGDGQPTWFAPRPASEWQVGDDGAVGIIDAHTIHVPDDVPPGPYELVVGWYDWETGARLSRLAGAGNPVGDGAVLGPVTIDPMAGPRPDACCVAAEACCASIQ
jgi:hypothetical protein